MTEKYNFDYILDTVLKWDDNTLKGISLNVISGAIPFNVKKRGEEGLEYLDYNGNPIKDFDEWYDQRIIYMVKLAELINNEKWWNSRPDFESAKNRMGEVLS